MQIFEWIERPRHLDLSGSKLQIWIAPLDSQNPEEFWLYLSADERQRADRLKRPEVWHRFVVGRGILRVLLGAYLGLEPGDLVFQYSPQGKPGLSGCGEDKLAFNLSHSGGVAVYGFTAGSPVGIDIEKLSPDIDLLAVAAYTMSPQETAQIMEQDDSERLQFFYRFWTCKEAVLKMIGSGFYQSMKSLSVECLDPAADCLEIALPDGERIPVRTITPRDGYICSVAH